MAVGGPVLTTGTGAFAQSYTLTTLANFTSGGVFPDGELALDSQGDLFGTASQGGTSFDGTVFEIVAGTKTTKTLATFNGTNGADPYGDMVLGSNGNLYGTTSNGGAGNYGTVFEVASGSSAITTLAAFNNANGANAYGGVTADGSGNLYGTTSGGGTSGYGTTFEVVSGSNTIKTLAQFNNTAGAYPESGLTLGSAGNLYGTASGGGSMNEGSVYEIAAGTNTITALASFTGANGADPMGDVTLDSQGNLYGTTTNGGAFGAGTVWEVIAGTNALTTLASFNGADGGSPQANLTIGSNGYLYGTTYGGGANGDGTVFDIAPGTNTITTLVSFNGTDGEQPGTGLTLGSNGVLYGETIAGGTSGNGTVFALTPTGSAAAPEPAALALLLTALPIGVLARRRIPRCEVQ